MKIDHNVPIPPKRGLKSQWTAIAVKMQPGDSVLCKTRVQAGCLANALNSLYPGNVSCATNRAVDGGFRVWRLR